LSETRTAGFRRNPLLEQLLAELGDDLAPAEERLVARYRGRPADFPVVLVFGPLRSGTTLFMQWLANTGLAACPTNLLSRFYRAPIIGAKIQRLLTDPQYSFRGELGDFAGPADYQSENGKTKGALAPNEFWYFWRRFLPDPGRDVWTDEELLRGMNASALLAELTGITDVFRKPLAAKAMLFNYNIRYLDSILDTALFVQLRRNQVDNAASVLEARQRQLGNRAAWYSFEIPEYAQLKNLDPIEQAAGQVHFINRAVTAGMTTVDARRRLVVNYEDFCANPAALFAELAPRLGGQGLAYDGPAGFAATRTSDPALRRRLEAAFAALGQDSVDHA